MTPSSAFPRPRRIPSALRLAGAALALLLAGCNLFGGGGGGGPLIPRPTFLQPEIDAFAEDSARVYAWSESLRRDGDDSLLALLSLRVIRSGESITSGGTRPVVALQVLAGNAGLPFSATAPAPAAALTRLGLPPDRVFYDTLAVPDAGPALGFPFTPVIGWRQDTVVGDLRLVRVLDRVQIVKQGGFRHECWAFAESTYVDEGGNLLGVGVTWMGRSGLVRHRSEWMSFFPSSTEPGTLFREITAQELPESP